ncbi:hypothetical protein Pyn_29420 [Prunus yedoensis var. nudiflora]|uniref:Uncharacterized protein n=1 Tax=Prunus yedoensis var. nudiflora TaxID=2094558 RepID=A0A314UEL3_PRUYE|nr:hypothetical protein Pyn_29420 [Prunus yedoensis var. nudiflora]
MNQWEGIIAAFSSVTKGMEVELCGIRLVYEQDLKGLIQTITQYTINSPPVYYQRSDETVVLEGGEHFSFLHMTGSLLEKAKSMGSNFLDTVGCPFPLQRMVSGESYRCEGFVHLLHRKPFRQFQSPLLAK